MSGQNKDYYFVDACRDDDNAILEILETPDFDGDLAVIYTRRPSPTLSFKRSGQLVKLMLCKMTETNELIGFGCCSINRHWVDGQIKKVAYFSGLRVKPTYRKTLYLLSNAYKAMLSSAEISDVDYIYTTILADNTAVQKMFEKPRRFFPNYLPIDDYRVLSIAIKKRNCNKRDFIFERATAKTLADYLTFYNDHAKHYDFSYYLQAEDFTEQAALKLDYNHFYAIKDKQSGTILAVAYAWQQLDYKQHIVKSYDGIYRIIRPFSALLPYFDYPKLPPVGSTLRYYYLSFLACHDQSALLPLIDHIAIEYNNCDYFLVGLSKKNPLYQPLKKLTKLTYDSKAYLIDTIKDEQSKQTCLSHTKNHFECGLL